MKIKFLFTFFAILFVYSYGGERVLAQNPSSLNEVRILHCGDKATVDRWIQDEQKRGLVIDARPFAINQTTGISSFNGKTGHVAVVHMNPFVYKYTISVAQQELVSSAVTDFIELLLPEGLRPTGKTQSGAASKRLEVAAAPNKLEMIAARLSKFTSEKDCADPKHAGCKALLAIKDEFDKIKDSLTGNDFDVITNDPPDEVGDYETAIIALRNEQADAYTTCNAATALNTSLTTFDPSEYADELNTAKNQLTNITSLANDLVSLVDEYGEDSGLKDHVVRCEGFLCVKQFKAYAEAALELIGLYEQDLAVRLATAEEMKRMLDLTKQMENKNGLFARTFDVIKKFELSAATVSISRENIPLRRAETPDAQAGTQSGTGGKKNPKPAAAGGASTTGSAANANGSGSNDAAEENGDKAADNEEPDEEQPSNGGNGNGAATGQINESIQIGRPRFLLSGGLVFSPLRRQTFEKVQGFTHDANGNPTGAGNTNIVGFGENSSRRLMPMVILNTRLRSFNPTSLFLSLGVTAKHDDNVDIEYLLGPSVSLLNDRALVTFGAYVGKVQNLVPDVKFGDEIPHSVGDDAKLFTKRYSWKPGFSFSYVFSETEKREPAASGDGGSSADDLKNEIRIGGIPFNLALGMAYTSLEERTFNPIVGFARDRQGNLTNGETLTRIVGVTSSSDYRLVPLALLHSRLLNFGDRSFYFSTGVTGKKTDNNVHIEYLLGGSTNLYRRKVFVTVGAFAGKQQLLGGDLFTGLELETSQPVTTQSRYVWKPAFAISYDISRIIPRGSN